MHGATLAGPTIPFEQTAAGRMTPRIPIVKSGSTLADLQALLWKSVTEFDTTRDAFVVDAKGHLLGTVTTRTIFLHRSSRWLIP
jgi:Mg/Co/Ni transporter MgtE